MPIYTIQLRVETTYEVDIIADDIEGAQSTAYEKGVEWGTQINKDQHIISWSETPTDMPYDPDEDD